MRLCADNAISRYTYSNIAMGCGMQVSDRIGRRMKLHDLNVLMAVVQAGSMSKAAALLNTTQSAISRSIAELEHAVGARLLDRNAQGVEATQCGHALLKRGVAVFDELKQGIQDIEFLSDPTAGELRIGASAAISEGIVAAAVDRLSRRYPRIVFHVEQAGTLALYDELRARRVELGIARLHGAESPGRSRIRGTLRRAVGRGGRIGQSLASPPQDQAPGAAERALDLAGAARCPRCRRLSRKGDRAAARDSTRVA